MRTVVIITDGNAKIMLYPESEFEKDLIEKVKDSNVGYKTDTEISATSNSYGQYKDHQICIYLTENGREESR